MKFSLYDEICSSKSVAGTRSTPLLFITWTRNSNSQNVWLLPRAYRRQSTVSQICKWKQTNWHFYLLCSFFFGLEGGGNRHRIRVLVSSLFIADPKLSSQHNSYHLCIRPARHASPPSLLYIVSLIRKLIRLVIKGTQKLSQTMRWQGLSAHPSGPSVSCLFQSYCAMGIRTYKKTPTSDCGDDLFESRLMTAQS